MTENNKPQNFNLRLTQTRPASDTYQVEIALEGLDLPRRITTVSFKSADLEITTEDQANLRWYFEDYLQYPSGTAPDRANDIRRRLNEIGNSLFRTLFRNNSNDDAYELWVRLSPELENTRVEVVTDAGEGFIPWELLRDPKSGQPLALAARAFVRAQPQVLAPNPLPTTGTILRVLLVICRPGAGKDLPFRSIAGPLVKTLGMASTIKLTVLRPPTFEKLGRVLQEARAANRPFHIVHFDGHGVFGEGVKAVTDFEPDTHPLLVDEDRPGRHGYVIFERDPEDRIQENENLELVQGTRLGNLLAQNDVALLVLNACRSAHAENYLPPEAAPTPPAPGSEAAAPPVSAPPPESFHNLVLAYGSVAQEVMATGVSGVVAMNYNIFVTTATQFLGDVYSSLGGGTTLGEAVSLARKRLRDQPLRSSPAVASLVELQDWPVPVVYEAAPLAFLPLPQTTSTGTIILQPQLVGNRDLDPNLPPPPDVGFLGRDDTILALDRAFDIEKIVLLYAEEGNGKTTTACEFARWYLRTGGVKGPVVFTSFEKYKPLGSVLDSLAQHPSFARILEKNQLQWVALRPDERQNVVLQIFTQLEVLWIWNNVEAVAGFPEGTLSPWSAQEQAELVKFLREARETRARFLLTSRRDEKEWLGTLPRTIEAQPMLMAERMELAQALAVHLTGERLARIEDWRPLLAYTQGNPATLMTLLSQALREKVETAQQVLDFVHKMQENEKIVPDEHTSGHSPALSSSMVYGFIHNFNDQQRQQLALFHLFQSVVDLEFLVRMASVAGASIPALQNTSRESLQQLLDSAALNSLVSNRGDGLYGLEISLSWYFENLFNVFYPSNNGTPPPPERAFVSAAASYYPDYKKGDPAAIAWLARQENNLLKARQLALKNGWLADLMLIMQGLEILYLHLGHLPDWARLLDELQPFFTDPETGGPLPEKADFWVTLTGWKVNLAANTGQWPEAETLQDSLVAWYEKATLPGINSPPTSLDDNQRALLDRLTRAVETLQEILAQHSTALTQKTEAIKQRLAGPAISAPGNPPGS